MQSQPSSKRGRKEIPQYWTRVISIDEQEQEEPTAHKIEDDLKYEYATPQSVLKQNKKSWKPLFDPKEWWMTNDAHQLEENKLKDRRLKILGKNATELRKIFADKAEALTDLKKTDPMDSL